MEVIHQLDVLVTLSLEKKTAIRTGQENGQALEPVWTTNIKLQILRLDLLHCHKLNKGT
jgi:hypothetical protein